MALTPWVYRDAGGFRAGTHKEGRCFAAECGPDPFGHTRALEGPYFDPGSKADRVREYRKLKSTHTHTHTHKERA